MTTINRAPWAALVDDSGQNLDGSIWNKAAIKDVLLDPIDLALADVNTGSWAAVPFSAANFVVNSGTGTWTVTAGNVTTYAWIKLTPKTVHLSFYVAGVLTGAPTALGILFPAGLTAPPRATGAIVHYFGTGQNGFGIALAEVGATRLRILRDLAGTAFAADSFFTIVGQTTIGY